MKHEITYKVKGMHCGACASAVQKILNKQESIIQADVNLLMEQVHIVYEQLEEENWKQAVEKAGFSLMNQHIEQVIFLVNDMHCSACSSNIEKKLASVDGIMEVHCNLLNQQVCVRYEDSTISSLQIKNLLIEYGYTPTLFHAQQHEEQSNKKTMKLTLILGVVLLYIGMSHMMYLPLPSILDPMYHPILFIVVQFLLATLILGLNFDICKSGLKALQHKIPNMDTLVMLGAGSAYVYSFYSFIQYISGKQEAFHHLYFESAGVIIACIVLGKFLEEKAKKQTTKALQELIALQVNEACVLKDGKEVVVSIDSIQKDDIVVVKAGEKIPLDGVIVKGCASIDEQMMSGESMPVMKQEQDKVIGGTMNIDGMLHIQVEKLPYESQLATIIHLVEQAQSQKAPIAKLADKIASIFVPVVCLIALVAAIVWLLIMKDVAFAITIFVSVLVIACPCALGLATPTAIMVGTLVSAKHQVFIKSGPALQQLSKSKAIVFDKTGTLTKGTPYVSHILSERPKEEILQIAKTLEMGSTHPLAHAIVQKAQTLQCEELVAEEIKTFAGLGVAGILNHKHYAIGNATFMKENKVVIDAYQKQVDDFQKVGKSIVYVSEEQQLIACIACEDEIKAESKEMVQACKKMGIAVVMLSGDSEAAANYIAQQIGIDHVISQVKPDEKANHIKALKQRYENVTMVGDGINDAIALTESNVGIAIGSGSDIAIESADVVLMKDNLLDVLQSMKLSKEVLKVIKQNLFWAFFYNCSMIPIAAGVLYILNGTLLSPMLAAIAMSFSSISVVLNALRLYRFPWK